MEVEVQIQLLLEALFHLPRESFNFQTILLSGLLERTAKISKQDPLVTGLASKLITLNSIIKYIVFFSELLENP